MSSNISLGVYMKAPTKMEENIRKTFRNVTGIIYKELETMQKELNKPLGAWSAESHPMWKKRMNTAQGMESTGTMDGTIFIDANSKGAFPYLWVQLGTGDQNRQRPPRPNYPKHKPEYPFSLHKYDRPTRISRLGGSDRGGPDHSPFSFGRAVFAHGYKPMTRAGSLYGGPRTGRVLVRGKGRAVYIKARNHHYLVADKRQEPFRRLVTEAIIKTVGTNYKAKYATRTFTTS